MSEGKMDSSIAGGGMLVGGSEDALAGAEDDLEKRYDFSHHKP